MKNIRMPTVVGLIKAENVMPQVTSADAGKLATVDSNGKWAAVELEVGQGEVAVDNTLLVSGAAADAKVTGDKVNELKIIINNRIPVSGESIVNDITQIPLDWESGTITNGSDQPNQSCIRTKGYLCVFDWATLKINQTAADPALYVSEYDKDQVFLNRYAYYAVGDHTPQEEGCRFIRLATYSSAVPAEQHSQYFTAYYDNQYSVSKLYSTTSEVKAEQQIVNRTVVGADIKLASAAYEIGANKNNDGNATYILKNISFSVTNGDMLHVKCDNITNASNSTPIYIYQYNSGGTQVGINQYTKAAIIKGIDIIPNTDTASVTVRLYPSVSGGLTDTTAVYTNIIIYLSKRNSNFDYLSKKTARIFKKVVCVGDSYTEGWFKAPGESERTLDPDYAWPHYMSDITGNHWMNCGVSGATTLSWLTDANGLAKAQTLGVSQAYVIGLMINDISSVTLGTSSDIGTDSPTTYYGGLSKIIRELATISPNAHIFVNTCPKTGTNYDDFNNAVRTVVNAYKNTYKVYCVDLSANAELYDVPSFTGDAIEGHYTAIGYEQMAEIYCYLLSDYINNHISTFQDVYKLPFDPVN